MKVSRKDIQSCVKKMGDEVAYGFNAYKKQTLEELNVRTRNIFKLLNNMGIDANTHAFERNKYNFDPNAKYKDKKAYLQLHFMGYSPTEFDFLEALKERDQIHRDIKLIPTLLQSTLNRLAVNFIKDEKFGIYKAILNQASRHPFFTTIQPLSVEPQWRYGWPIVPEETIFGAQTNAITDIFENFDLDKLIQSLEASNLIELTEKEEVVA